MTISESFGSIPDVIASKLGVHALERCLAKAGLPENPNAFVGAYVPQISLNRLLDEAAQSAGNDMFGLEFVDHLCVREYGAWGDYILEAPNLGSALKRAESIIHLHANKDRLRLRNSGETTFFEYRFGERISPGYRQVALAALGPLLSIPRYFLGSNWQPVSIGLDISDASSRRLIETRLNIDVRLGEACLSLELHNADLACNNRRVPSVWTTRADVERACNGGPPSTLVECVMELIHQMKERDELTLDSVASTLAISRRTLQRNLNREGVTFRCLVGLAKMRRARDLLAGSPVTVSEIAMSLDYSTPGHFARAFKRVHGLSPLQYRHANCIHLK
ncbi:AraC family transcriptional regulator ligand-binding domain-containing protein [Labrenzia sp. R4_2]|uniref:AraC family transcriptional regulator n=1 Tax=Labrenzia sp. R4_2 TaxID=2821107 RepID=UPI001AD9F7F3|nr:AraC family transcriptional regulator [Labrenzia sp. R4_2]MBO9419213.1 AraC family transcriptional regulator ligand-binding domain-containing protein [Labrenzia sp. R4_2]